MSARKLRHIVVVLGAAATTTAVVLATASPASAIPGSEIDYNATGSTTLTNPNSQVTVNFAPAVLRSFIDFDDTGADVRAILPLAPAKAAFKAYGFLPASGTVVFTQVGLATGRLSFPTEAGNYPLSVTAKYVVSLRDVVIGNTRANVGPNCQTQRPVVATVSSDDFTLSDGTLNGTYTLSPFINCGNASHIINNTLSGSGNTLRLAIHLGDSATKTAAVARALHTS